MKIFTAQISYFIRHAARRRNTRLLLKFLAVLASMVASYSVVFHLLMEQEGQEHSWITGFYWTLTVMSTLGFGDITFTSDAGRVFSMIVLLSGMIFLLILLPFTFIEFFYAPWMQAQAEARAPRKLPEGTKGHVILTHFDPVTRALIEKLKRFGYSYAVVISDLAEALRLHDEGLRVVVGEIDDPETYLRLRVEQAAMVVATGDDRVNTNVAFTVREHAEAVPIVTMVKQPCARDILAMAGSTHVLHLGDMMGAALARHTIGGDAQAHVLGNFEEVQIAEATAAGTPLTGKTLAEAQLRQSVGVNVIGMWERGRFEIGEPGTVISESSVLLLAGSAEQIAQYNALFCIYHVAGAPVVILGGGRVGRATGEALERRQLDYRIVELLPERAGAGHAEKTIVGDAAEIETLEKAGLMAAPTVIITTHDDDLNIFLTLYCRRLRPDIQVISRSSHQRNVSTLHRAGADFVLSYASMGSNAILNLLKRGDVVMVAEGLSLFKARTPPSLAGATLAGSRIRDASGCSVVGMRDGDATTVNPGPETLLPEGGELILVGTDDAQRSFLNAFPPPQR